MKYLVSSSLAAILSVFTFSITHLIWTGSYVNSSAFYAISIYSIVFGYVGGFIGHLYLKSQKSRPLFNTKNAMVFLVLGAIVGIILEWIAGDGIFIGFLSASIVGALTFFFANGIKSKLIMLIIIPIPFIIVFGFPWLDKV